MFVSKKLLIFIFITPSLALACIRQSVQFAIIGSDENTTIQKSVNSEQKEELLDNTGYITSHLLVAAIINSTLKENINSTIQKNKIIALKERLDVLDKKMNAILTKKELTNLEFKKANNIKNAIPDIKKLNEIIVNNPSRVSLEKIWKSIESKLNSNSKKSTNIITTQNRVYGAKTWSKNLKLLTDFKLPTVSAKINQSRSAGCADELFKVILLAP